GLACFPSLRGGHDSETAHSLVVGLPYSAVALGRHGALPPGGRARYWFLSGGPPGVGVGQRSAGPHGGVAPTGSETLPASRALQSGGRSCERPGRDRGRKEGGTKEGAHRADQRQPWHQFNPQLDRNVPGRRRRNVGFAVSVARLRRLVPAETG